MKNNETYKYIKEIKVGLEKAGGECSYDIDNCKMRVNKAEQVLKEVVFKIPQIVENLNKQMGELKNFNTKMRMHEAVFDTKEHVKELEDRINQFTSIQHVSYLKEDLLPKMEDTMEHVRNMTASNHEMRECIRRFDEDLSLKAGKSALALLKEHIGNNYVSKDNTREMQEKMTSLLADMQSQKE